MPENLDDLGKRAYNAIKKHLRDFEDMSTGGCKAFYSPIEWAERGESYGRGSKLIIVYDGGDLRPYMNMDACYEGHCMMMGFYQEMGVSGKSEPYGMYEKVCILRSVQAGTRLYMKDE